MKESLERIKTLHSEGKISDEEYQKLLAAVSDKPILNKLSFRILTHPHQYMNKMNAFIVGSIFLLFFSFVASHSFIHFPGTLDFKIVDNRAIISLWYILFQNGIIVLSLAILYWLGGIASKAPEKRIINYLGPVALSRIPYLLATLAFMVSVRFVPEIRYLGASQPTKISLAVIITMIIVVPFVIWQIASYFSALKSASKLSGIKIWLVFIPAIILSETATLTAHHKVVVPKMKISLIGKDKPTQEAITFATDWLHLMDKGSYSQCWEAGSTTFQAAISKGKWVETGKARASYGRMITREVFSTKNEGEYIRVIFKGSYEEQDNLYENVTLVREGDQWRLSGYFLR